MGYETQNQAKMANWQPSHVIHFVLQVPVCSSVLQNDRELFHDNRSEGSAVQGIIIHSKLRSGSTFTREMFRRSPDVFFMYEPIHLLPTSEWRNRSRACEVIRRTLHCDLDFVEEDSSHWMEAMLCDKGSGCPPCTDLSYVDLAAARCKASQFPAIKVIVLEEKFMAILQVYISGK